MELELEARRLRDCARAASERIFPVLDKYKGLKEIGYFTSRIKGLARIVDKVMERRKNGDPMFSASALTDICGYRIVTYFQSGVGEAFDYILKLVQHDHPNKNFLISPFVQGQIRQIEIYTTRPEDDPLSVVPSIKRLAADRRLECEVRVKEKPTGYSSVHLILECIVQVEGEKDQVFPVEFQLRSGFEDIWGQIDHRLRYSPNRGGIDTTSWDGHLNVLKTLVDGCLQYAQLIKDQSDRATGSKSSQEPSKKSIEGSDVVLKELRNVPRELYLKLEHAYGARDTAEKCEDEIRSREKFVQAATAFEDAFHRAEALIGADENRCGAAISEHSQEATELRYWLPMDLAYCYLNTFREDDLSRAITIYERVEADFPNDVVSRYRHGQALRRQEKYVDAAKWFEAAMNILEGRLDPRITKRQEWLRVGVRLQLGYVKWRMSNAFPASVEGRVKRRSALADAISYTGSAYEIALAMNADWDDKCQILNNIVYYGWEERQAFSSGQALSERKFSECIGEFRRYLEVDKQKSALPLDTLCRALDYIGDVDSAKKVARAVIERLEGKALKAAGFNLSEISHQFLDAVKAQALSRLDADDQDCLNFAYRILLKGQ